VTRTFVFIAFFISLAILLTSPAKAQRHFGIVWNPPASESEAARELFRYQQIGIRTLMIEGIHDMGIVDVLNGFDFKVIVRIPQPYLTASRLDNILTEARDLVLQHTDYYRGNEFIAGYILFSDGQINSRRFTRRMEQILREFRIQTDRAAYFITGNTTNTFSPDQKPDGMIVRISENSRIPAGAEPRSFLLAGEPDSVITDDAGIPVSGFLWDSMEGLDIRIFQEMLQLTRPYVDIPVFLQQNWVSSHLNDGLDEILIAYAGDSDVIFPNPVPETPPPATNWHIIILLLIWISFAIHYAYFPTYNKSLFRYFANHQFFIDDIFERRIRFTLTPLFINLQTALIFGLFFYSILTFHVNSTGIEVIRHYLYLPEWMNPHLFIFLSAVLFKLVFNGIMTAWVFAPSLDTRWANPAAVTYIWPQQFLLPVITLMLTVNMAGGSAILFNLLAVLFLLIWLSSYYIAAFNMRLYVERKSLYDGLSWGLQIPLLILALWWILLGSGLWDVFRLAAFVQ
jgi:hypothetical protein